MDRNWKAIEGYEDYSVSDTGQIWSIRRQRYMIPRLNNKGYLLITLRNKAIPKTFTVHSLVAKHFIGERPYRYDINHKDTNKTNNNKDNLEYLKHSENIKHAFNLGLYQKEENHKSAKLKNVQVIEIHNLYKSGKYTHRALAKKFNVVRGTIADILSGRIWKNIQRAGIE